jgi:hypothetical protein
MNVASAADDNKDKNNLDESYKTFFCNFLLSFNLA